MGAHPSRAIYTITVQTSSVTVPAGVFNHTNEELRASERPLEASARLQRCTIWSICCWPRGFFKFHQKRFLYSLEIHRAFMCWAVKKLNEKPF